MHRLDSHLIKQILSEAGPSSFPAVFDFDFTLFAGDSAELQFKELIKLGLLNYRFDTYEEMLKEGEDIEGCVKAHIWMTERLESLSISEIISALEDGMESVAFFPSMVELLGELLLRKHPVWILSATNQITVQYLVQEYLNPLLNGLGYPPVKISQVIGMKYSRHESRVKATIKNNHIQWNKISPLKCRLPLERPCPSGQGKALYCQKFICPHPFLVASDSLTDLPLLKMAKYSLRCFPGANDIDIFIMEQN